MGLIEKFFSPVKVRWEEAAFIWIFNICSLFMLGEDFFFFFPLSTACVTCSDTWGRLSLLQANQGDVLHDGIAGIL